MDIKKILVDENLSKKLVNHLAIIFPGSIHVSDKALVHVSDKDIWQFALSNNYAILSKDMDFLYLSNLLGCPPKVIRLNCGNQSTISISQILKNKLEVIASFLDNETDGLCYLEIE